MPSYAYTIKFPCPKCGGLLTMSGKNNAGNCPLCNCPLSANFDIQVGTEEFDEIPVAKGSDKRAFRRPDTAKPVWNPPDEPEEPEDTPHVLRPFIEIGLESIVVCRVYD